MGVTFVSDADAWASRLLGIHTCVSVCDSGNESGAGGHSICPCCM